MIITIDGPAGAGKSTVARALARRLGYRYLDTGAMYRTVALAGLRRGVDWQRPEEIARLARQLTIEVRDAQIFLDGEDVTDEIRSSEVTAVTRFAADNPEVRCIWSIIAASGGRPTAGGHRGTRPGHGGLSGRGCKIFLTASPEV